MPRDYSLFINDMKVACEKILRYTKNLTHDQFLQNEIIYDAVLRNLIVIGEAAKNIPEEGRGLFKDIDWKKICGLRDILTHAYFGIDESILWDVIQSKIPALLNSLSLAKI